MHNKILVIIIVISLTLGAFTLTRGHEWGDDFASYIMQAESILHGTMNEFVVHNSFTIFESSNQIGPVAYPWGYPLLLTPMYAITGNHPLALKLPGLFFYAAFLVCLFLLIKAHFTPVESLLITALFAFNPMMLGFLDHIASDVPFLFCSTLVLWLMVSNEKTCTLRYAMLGVAIAGAFVIRATGILLLGSFLVVQFIDIWKNRTNPEAIKRLIANSLLVVGTFGILWILYSLLFPGGGESYFAQYKDFKFETVGKFVIGYFQVFGLFFGEQTSEKILYYATIPFFLIGCWTRKKEDILFIIFFILWMTVLVTWPFWQGPRFIFPLLPLCLYFTFAGIQFVLSKLPENYRQVGQWSFYGFWSLIAAVFLFTSVNIAYTNLKNNRVINGPYDSYSKEVYEYIKEETAADSVIVFFKPRAMRLMTGHDSIVSIECERILKGDILVLSRKVGKNQQIPPEEIGSCNLPLREIFKNTRFIVYEIPK